MLPESHIISALKKGAMHYSLDEIYIALSIKMATSVQELVPGVFICPILTMLNDKLYLAQKEPIRQKWENFG